MDIHNRKYPKRPTWWHTGGAKMKVTAGDERHYLTISNKRAYLTISKASLTDPKDNSGWNLRWEIEHRSKNADKPYGKIAGKVYFSDEQLTGAFELADDHGDTTNEINKRFLVSSGVKGKYVRVLNCLNIPCPGSSLNGDPNISVYCTEEIKAALRTLQSD